MMESRRIQPLAETVPELFSPVLKAQPEVPAMQGSRPDWVPSQQVSAPLQVLGLHQVEQQEEP
jgi:hypothetical protein